MAKQAGSGKKGLEARISHLHRAAAYLSHIKTASTHPTKAAVLSGGENEAQASPHGQGQETPGSSSQDSSLARHYLCQLKDVSLKAQIRLSPAIKHSMCRRCGVYLEDKGSMQTHLDNPSSGARKPWAQVKVFQCLNCGHCRRVPVGTSRQPRKTLRTSK